MCDTENAGSVSEQQNTHRRADPRADRRAARARVHEYRAPARDLNKGMR